VDRTGTAFDFDPPPGPRQGCSAALIYGAACGGSAMGGQPHPAERQGSLPGLIDLHPALLLRSLGVQPPWSCCGDGLDPQIAPTGAPQLLGYSPLELGCSHRAIWWGRSRSKLASSVRALVTPVHRRAWRCCWMWSTTTPAKATRTVPPSAARLCDALYYQQNESSEYQDVTGCGNTIAGHRPLGRRLIHRVDALLALELGIRWLPLLIWASPSPAARTCCRGSAALFEGGSKPIGAQRPEAW